MIATAGDGSAIVSWTPPASDGGARITGYLVTSTPDGKTCRTGGSTLCTVGGLANGTTYSFGVVARNRVGPGPSSAPSNAVTPTARILTSAYHAMDPARLVDTRVGNGLAGALEAGTPATFQVTGRDGIPSNATAVTGNLTVTGSTAGWAVFLGPQPEPAPSTSTIDFSGGQVLANGLTVALSSSGSLSATYVSSPGNTTDLVFDVTGYFAPGAGETYHAIDPTRVVDSRFGNGLSASLQAGVPATFTVAGRNGIPSDAKAVTANVTVADATSAWAVYVGPVATVSPTTSTVNFAGGQVESNNLTVALGPGGTLSATYLSHPGNSTDLVFDVTGYYTSDSTGSRFVPISPARVVDTRIALGSPGRIGPGAPSTFAARGGASGVPDTAVAVTGDLKVTGQTGPWAMFLGPNPAPSPSTSTVNFEPGTVGGNGLTVALSSAGTLSATYMANPGNSTDLVFDVTGYYVP